MTKEYIVLNGVRYVRADSPPKIPVDHSREKWTWLTGSVDNANREGTALYEDMKANAFTFGTAEAEGYLRGIRFVLNEMKMINESYDESNDESKEL